jgi:hypothetical protein
MRTWTRARKIGFCGHCGKQYARDEPIQLLTVGRIVKARCRVCADGPVPDDIPDAAVASAKVTTAVTVPGLLPLDWRRRAANDREPGEEG